MNNQLQNINNNNINQPAEILNSNEYKKLPQETQVKLLEYMLRKKIDFTQEQQNYLLQHLSSDTDTNQYLDYLEKQRDLQRRSDGLTVSYTSHETKTPTGKISSKSTQTTVHTGCLLPVIAFMLLFCFLVLI